MKVRGPRAGSIEGQKGHQSPPGCAPHGGGGLDECGDGVGMEAAGRLPSLCAVGPPCVDVELACNLCSMPLKCAHTRLPLSPSAVSASAGVSPAVDSCPGSVGTEDAAPAAAASPDSAAQPTAVCTEPAVAVWRVFSGLQQCWFGSPPPHPLRVQCCAWSGWHSGQGVRLAETPPGVF